MHLIDKYLKGDKVIWMVALIFALLSIPAVYSYIIVPAIKSKGGNTEFFLFKHTILVGTGFILMFYAHSLKFKYYSRISQVGIWMAGILLIMTLAFGTSKNEATRWFMGFQPSDLAKMMLIIFVARMLAQKQNKIKNFKEGVLPVAIPVFIICLLILPADFSTAAMLFTTCLIQMFIGRVGVKHIFSLIGISIAGFALLLLVANVAPKLLPRVSTWQERLVSYESEDPQKNYQVNMAKIGIANGGLIGQGPGQGNSKHVLPLAWADFIYAAFIEEYGSLFGGIGLMLLYLILLFRSVRIATRCPSNFGAFLAVGLGFSLVFQAMINMAVSTNILPVTGQTLPLMSMGGTSLWFTCLSLGIILSVSRSVYDEEGVKMSKNYAVA